MKTKVTTEEDSPMYAYETCNSNIHVHPKIYSSLQCNVCVCIYSICFFFFFYLLLLLLSTCFFPFFSFVRSLFPQTNFYIILYIELLQYTIFDLCAFRLFVCSFVWFIRFYRFASVPFETEMAYVCTINAVHTIGHTGILILWNEWKRRKKTQKHVLCTMHDVRKLL